MFMMHEVVRARQQLLLEEAEAQRARGLAGPRARGIDLAVFGLQAPERLKASLQRALELLSGWYPLCVQQLKSWRGCS